VSRPGAYAVNGRGVFPIPPERRLQIASTDAVLHTTRFGHPATSEKLLAWLA
jgi:hypothetical protein